jgi:hypothetical protein
MDIKIQIIMSIRKKVACEGTYPLMPEGLNSVAIRNDTASIIISAKRVSDLNFCLSIRVNQSDKRCDKFNQNV